MPSPEVVVLELVLWVLESCLGVGGARPTIIQLCYQPPDYWVLCVDEKADSLEIDKEEIPVLHLETFIRKRVQLVGF